MSEYSARQEAWMARVAYNTPEGYWVSLGWPREEHYRAVMGHWKCHECGHEYSEKVTGRGTFTEDDFIEESCEECSSLNTHLNIVDDEEFDGDLGFSWGSCDLCGCHLGGDRYEACLIHNDKDTLTLEICGDCLQYVANSETPDEENLTWL
jgi:hypothetical protein